MNDNVYSLDGQPVGGSRLDHVPTELRRIADGIEERGEAPTGVCVLIDHPASSKAHIVNMTVREALGLLGVFQVQFGNETTE